MRGWVFDQRRGRVPEHVLLAGDDDTVIVAAIAGAPRPEVAEVLNLPAE